MNPMKTCTKCGRSFPATPQYFHRHFPAKDGLKPRCRECSNEDLRQAIGREVFKNGLTCERCGQVFTRKGSRGPVPKYCSPRCDILTRQANQWANRISICVECGQAFYVTAKGQEICSHKCYLARMRHQQGAARRERGITAIGAERTRECAHCGQSFVYHHARRIRLYCTRKCACEAARTSNPERTRKQKSAIQQIRRARMFGAECERIDIDKLYDRDGGRCGICNKHVKRSEASVDHIIPLSLGGNHIWANVQLTHLMCNVRRGNRGPGQLRLQVV